MPHWWCFHHQYLDIHACPQPRRCPTAAIVSQATPPAEPPAAWPQQGARQCGSHRGSQHQRKPGPHCTYDRCEKPVGHWESTCLQKARDIRGRRDASKRDRSTSSRRNPRRFRRHHRDVDEEEDNANEEKEDSANEEEGSTHGDEN